MLDTDQLDIVAQFLAYSFKGAQWDYDQLTAKERTFCTRAQFNALTRWVKEVN